MIMIRSLFLSIFFFSQSVFAGCPFCYDGSPPPYPEMAPKVLGGSTCGDAVQVANSWDTLTDDSDCDNFLNMGLYCGCPVPEGRCTLCRDKSPPPKPTLKPQELGGFSCQEWAGLAASSDFPSDKNFTCEDAQFLGSTYCECPIPSQTDCPICYNGSQPPDPSFVPAPSVFRGATCQQLMAFMAPSSSNENAISCQEWRYLGAFCKCPLPDDACKLCENGSDLPNPDTILGHSTCDVMETYSLFETGENCTASQATLGVYCGCQNPQASAGFCRICGDNTLLPQPGLLAETNGKSNYSCAQIESNTQFNLDRPPLSCTELRNKYGSICCAGAAAPAKLGKSTSNSTEGNASAVVAPAPTPTTGNSGAVKSACSPITVVSATFIVLGALTLFC